MSITTKPIRFAEKHRFYELLTLNNAIEWNEATEKFILVQEMLESEDLFPRDSDGEWTKKAYLESQLGATVVVLLPARTDTAWFHDWVLGRAEIRFLRGRLIFEIDGHPVQYLNKKTGRLVNGKAPFPSMVIVYKPTYKRGLL